MAAKRFLEFVNASPSPFHAVHEIAIRLETAGFKLLTENDTTGWAKQLQLGGKYYFTRNQSTILAFTIGKKYHPGKGFNIIGAHTDSPCLKLKPNSKVTKSQFVQVGVQTYGGGLWHTWFDRDLSIAGRCIVKSGDKYSHRLVKIDEPILRIPNLAIHLDRTANEAFKFNAEDQLLPVLATCVKDQLGKETEKNTDSNSKYPSGAHHPVLIDLLIKKLGCNAEDIRDFELCLYDTQPSRLGGVYEEFIFSPRLDNLFSCWASLEGLIEASKDIENESNVLVSVMFDNEEVGSVSANGASSSLIENFIHRISTGFNPNQSEIPSDVLEISIRNSFLVSADMAHAVHPNYASKHEERHQPKMHSGPVIKHNANQRYATNAVTAFVIRELAQRRNIPIQEFVVKNDSLCGSTIGPLLSIRGLRTVDIGAPQLSMHSIREQMGVDDVDHTLNLCISFFKNFSSLDSQISIDDK